MKRRSFRSLCMSAIEELSMLSPRSLAKEAYIEEACVIDSTPVWESHEAYYRDLLRRVESTIWQVKHARVS